MESKTSPFTFMLKFFVSEKSVAFEGCQKTEDRNQCCYPSKIFLCSEMSKGNPMKTSL